MNYIATLEQLDRLADRARQEDLEKNQRLEGIPSRRSVRTSASRNSNSSSRGKSRDGGSNNRNYMKNDYVPSERCNDPTCDICSAYAYD
uniref:Reverse transcriptase domain-containing protein n=1 Tax=Bursaphelenchus xylophilus TaxID=6326 RepID=A0A1I7RZ74_BURXY